MCSRSIPRPVEDAAIRAAHRNLPDGRKIIVARGACDDKGQAMTFIEACRAFKAVTGKLPLPITMMIEGEEECGSKNLFGFVRDNAAEFKLDLALVCDTAMWDQKTPAMTTSLRGLVYEDVKIICADRDLHSGVFGGAAQNPMRLLSQNPRRDAGRQWTRHHSRLLRWREGAAHRHQGRSERPDLTAEKFLGPDRTEKAGGRKGPLLIEMVTTRPTAEINGMIGGYTGEGAKTVIPGEASAKVSFRLVGEQDPEKIRDAFRAFVRARCRRIARSSSGISGSRRRSSFRSTTQRSKARAVLAEEWGHKAVCRRRGGSIPIVADFKEVLGMDLCSSASLSTMTASIRRTRSSI